MFGAWVTLGLVLILLAAAPSAGAFDLPSLLGSSDKQDFKIVHVNDLVRMKASNQPKVVVLDANFSAVREQEGVIPGAVLLSSESAYDVSTELPRDKTAKLVFYCFDKA
jgi:signal transduction histidine kinase